MSSQDGAGFSPFLILPLLLICCLLPMLMQSRQKTQFGPKETDTWVTIKNTNEAFDDIKSEVEVWRQQVESQPLKKNLFPFTRTDKMPAVRFESTQSIPPRLLRLNDIREGEILFELTEIQDYGTSIKVTYDLPAKARIQTFKATFPIKIMTQWQSCPSCSKPVLPDYAQCPYCGVKLKEGNS